MKPTRATESERKPHPPHTVNENEHVKAAFKAFAKRKGMTIGWQKRMKKGKP